MEGGAPLNRFHGQTSNDGVHAASTAGASNEDTAPANAIPDQDRLMPIANVIRIMREVLPTHANISDGAKESIQECTSEFINFVTSKANERCHSEQRKTITADHILWAMSKLGFHEYIQPLKAYLQRHRELVGVHRGSLRGDPLALPIRQAPPQHPWDPTLSIPPPLPQLPYHLPPLPAQLQQQQLGMYNEGMFIPSPLPQLPYHLPPPPAQQQHQQLVMYNEGMSIPPPLPQLPFHLPQLQQQQMGMRGYYYTYGGDGSGSERGGGMDGAGPSNGPMGGFNPYGPYR